MLLTVIPFFREVIVVSFRCEHCGKPSPPPPAPRMHSPFPTSHTERPPRDRAHAPPAPPAPRTELTRLSPFAGYTNNDIQSAGEIQPAGAVYTVKMTERADLDRQMVKSEHCTIFIPEYQLQIPAGRGQFTTVEGIIHDTIRDLAHDQPVRKIQHPELAEQLQGVIDKLAVLVDDQQPLPLFTFKLDDPSGNSFLETRGGLSDPKWSKHDYDRTKEQTEALGLAFEEPKDSQYVEEVMSFPGTCNLCGSELETLMKTVNIPHFKVSAKGLWPLIRASLG